MFLPFLLKKTLYIISISKAVNSESWKTLKSLFIWYLWKSVPIDSIKTDNLCFKSEKLMNFRQNNFNFKHISCLAKVVKLFIFMTMLSIYLCFYLFCDPCILIKIWFIKWINWNTNNYYKCLWYYQIIV